MILKNLYKILNGIMIGVFRIEEVIFCMVYLGVERVVIL